MGRMGNIRDLSILLGFGALQTSGFFIADDMSKIMLGIVESYKGERAALEVSQQCLNWYESLSFIEKRIYSNVIRPFRDYKQEHVI